MSHPHSILVFHRGALGDSILLWPLLRRCLSRGHPVTLITDSAKARLAARELGITPLSAELPAFTALWAEPDPGRAHPSDPTSAAPARTTLLPTLPANTPRLILSFLSDPSTAPGQRWLRSTRALFPSAHIIAIPHQLDRPLALRLAGPPGLLLPAPLHNPAGPIIFHVGAGSPSKRWPMDRWAALHHLVSPRNQPIIQVIAGEVEHERFSPDDRRLLDSLRGRYLPTLPSLADALRAARLVIAADSGPAHLAAQLGVPTLTLFGPTDPARWAPIGPHARVLAPEKPRDMTWLAPETVTAEISAPFFSRA